MSLNQKERKSIQSIVNLIKDKQGQEIKIVDMKDHSVAADFFIITEGDNPKHVRAIADRIQEGLNEKPSHKEGLEANSWVALDYGNIWVHIFLDETREFYDLDGLWVDRLISTEQLQLQ